VNEPLGYLAKREEEAVKAALRKKEE